MSAIATLDLPTSKYGPEDDNQDDFTKGFTFLPRIQFFSDQSGPVKRRQFPMNHYGLVEGKETHDLGETFPGFPLGYRYKALDFREKGKVKSYYDPKSEGFLEVKREADKKRAPGEKSGCMYGAEFLIALQRDGKTVLGTLICSTNSWKMAAKKLFPLVHNFVSFGSKLVDGNFVYQAPEVSTFTGSFELGDAEKLRKATVDFVNASGTAAEELPDAEGGGEADRVR